VALLLDVFCLRCQPEPGLDHEGAEVGDHKLSQASAQVVKHD